MRTTKLLAAVLTAATLAIITPTTAGAVTVVDATATDVTVRYDGCRSSAITVQGDWSADPLNEIQVDVRNPGGRLVATELFYDDTDGLVSLSTQLCNGDRQGTYTVGVVATGFDEVGTETSRVEGGTTFQFTHIPKAGSRIRHRVYSTPDQRTYKYAVPGQLLRARTAYAGVRVVLAARIDGDWYAIDRARTQKRGLFAWRFKPNGYAWRYYFLGNQSTKPTRSDSFRTPRRASARAAAGPAGTATVADLKDLVSRG